MQPGALVIEPVVAGHVTLDEAIRRAPAQITGSGRAGLHIEPDASRHGPENMGRVGLYRRRLPTLFLDGGNAGHPDWNDLRSSNGIGGFAAK